VGNLRGRLRKQNTKGKTMMPLLAELGGSLHVGLAAVGSAIGVGIIGMKAAEATGRNPGAAGAIRNQAIIFAALAEGVVFFAIFLVKQG
jgi:F-type H+-transporting ATPase subunit c